MSTSPPRPYSWIHSCHAGYPGAENRREHRSLQHYQQRITKAVAVPRAGPSVGVWETCPGVNIKDLGACVADYVTYREDSRTFADVGIWNGQSVTVTEFADPERVDGLSLTFSLLPMLGVHPVLGLEPWRKTIRTKVLKLSCSVMDTGSADSGGDPKVIGCRIMADGAVREIIGVLPQGKSGRRKSDCTGVYRR